MEQQTDQQRIALVTGGAKGIGAAVSEQLTRDGLHVLIGDIDDEQARTKADDTCFAYAGISSNLY